MRIEVYKNENEFGIGTGFFIKLKIKIKEKYFLITCYHVIKEKYIKAKKGIKFYSGEVSKEKKLEIELYKIKRNIIYFDKPLYVTMIEILKEDKISKDKFLQPDFNFKNGYNYYLEEKINDFFI